MKSRIRGMSLAMMSAMLLTSCADAKESNSTTPAEAPTPQPTEPVQATAEGGPIYFDLSNDPNSLSLLHLSQIEQEGAKFLVARTDLFRGDRSFGMGTIWEVNCAQEQMKIIRAAQLAPGINPVIQDVDLGDSVRARATDQSWAMFQLVCTGAGNLDTRHVYRGDIQDITERFWAE